MKRRSPGSDLARLKVLTLGYLLEHRRLSLRRAAELLRVHHDVARAVLVALEGDDVVERVRGYHGHLAWSIVGRGRAWTGPDEHCNEPEIPATVESVKSRSISMPTDRLERLKAILADVGRTQARHMRELLDVLEVSEDEADEVWERFDVDADSYARALSRIITDQLGATVADDAN